MKKKDEDFVLMLHSQIERTKDVIFQKFQDSKAPSDFMASIVHNIMFGLVSIEYGIDAYARIEDAMNNNF